MKQFIISSLAIVFFNLASLATPHTLHIQTFDEVYVKGACNFEIRYQPDSIGAMLVFASQEVYQNIEKALVQRSLYISVPSANNTNTPRIVLYCDRNLQVLSVAERCKASLPQNITLSYDLSLIASTFATISSSDIKASQISISSTGGGHISLNGITSASNITISNVGSGRISLPTIKANDLSTTLRGSGSITIGGNVANTPNFVLKGSGSIDISNIHAPRISAAAYGEGFIYIPQNITIDKQGAQEHITPRQLSKNHK